MSRIGKRPITLPKNVNVQVSEGLVSVKGPKGELSFQMFEGLEVKVEEQVLSLAGDYKGNRDISRLMGTSQSTLKNMVQGVSEGFQKVLNLVGVGYRAQVSGQNLELNLGYSHPINYELPKGVTAQVKGTQVTLESCDKQLLGQVAANIRSFRLPEPYKGKGVIFADEVIRRKVGKSGKK